MPKYKAVVVHAVENRYDVEIEAENIKEAKELLMQEPFSYIPDDAEPAVEGLDLDVEDLEQVGE